MTERSERCSVCGKMFSYNQMSNVILSGAVGISRVCKGCEEGLDKENKSQENKGQNNVIADENK